MKATTKFIEDAIKGGWCDLMKGIPFEIIGGDIVTKTDKGFNSLFENVSVVLLDPKAWEAVGKVRGWDKRTTFYQSFSKINEENNEPWRLDIHRFIDNLADNKTIEEALQAIE